MQTMEINWLVFGLTLAALFLFAVIYAYLTRQMVIRKVEGQTVWMVVGGVSVVVTAFIPTFGLLVPVMVMAGFVAAGLPMIYEYVTRVHDAQRSDLENAKALAAEILKHDDTAPDR